MTNISGNAYALTILSPIRTGVVKGEEIEYADKVRDLLESWNLLPNSPMTQVPQTYLCRFFVLDDVYTESLPGASVMDTFADVLPVVPDGVRRRILPKEDRLKSRYLVFSSNFYGGPQGDVDGYLRGMWNAIGEHIKDLWGYCYGFDQVRDAATFVSYMKKCQLPVTLFFVGANDEPLPAQLKALYLKQEFARFAVANQGLEAAVLRANYQAFIARVAPTNLSGPTWEPGQYRL
ncbi:hypothetical protein [uncultured Thiodictyon sp.]|uniref:hypothetical protein n=1 Tax=uncultured Thiodictyon sp. TaxID=1846217 RepID=UPI0025D92270|nr:hypothetical protein [uncultured Thiodictyon sp.]